MELKIRDGDYVTDGAGGLRHVSGREALLQRVLFKLTARRGALPFLPQLGSRLYQLGGENPVGRKGAALQYVTEALSDEEDLSVTDVELGKEGQGRLDIKVHLLYEGEELRVPLTVR